MSEATAFEGTQPDIVPKRRMPQNNLPIRNILVFCAGSPKARIHFERAILNPIPLSVILPCFAPERHAELLQYHGKEGGVFAWGFKPSTKMDSSFKRMHSGDFVLAFFD